MEVIGRIQHHQIDTRRGAKVKAVLDRDDTSAEMGLDVLVMVALVFFINRDARIAGRRAAIPHRSPRNEALDRKAILIANHHGQAVIGMFTQLFTLRMIAQRLDHRQHAIGEFGMFRNANDLAFGNFMAFGIDHSITRPRTITKPTSSSTRISCKGLPSTAIMSAE